MRRLIAIALLGFFMLPAAAPLWAASEKPMPACCRAMGKHHCDGGHEMSMRKFNDGGIGFGVAQEKCPMRCCTKSRTASVTLPVSVRVVSLLAVREVVVHVENTSFVSAGFSSHTDRGPPALQSA